MSISYPFLRRLLLGGVMVHILMATLLQAQTYTPRTFQPSWKEQADALLTGQSDYPGAIALYKKWLEANPLDDEAWYNLACTYALSGDTRNALDAWEYAVDAGWNDQTHPLNDPDLASIRSDARFDAALKRIADVKNAQGPEGFIRRFGVVQTVGTYVVMLPPDYATSAKEYPICVILHGNGSTELRHGRLAESFGREGVIYVAPRAPYPNIGVMHGGDDGWTAWPPEDIDENSSLFTKIPLDYVAWIFNCIHDVQSNYRARKGKVFIYGHSQGAHFADLCALLRPEEVASYMAHAGRMPSETFATADALRGLKENGVRPYLLHGREDGVVLPVESEKLSAAFREAGVNHTLKIVDGDHGFSEAIRKEIRAWVEGEVRGER